MQATVTAKIKLNATHDDYDVLLLTIQAYTTACNHVSHHVYLTHDLSQSSLNKALYYQMRSLFSTKAQMTQSVIKTVIARYRTLLSNGDDWTEIKFKQGEYDLVWNHDYSLSGNIFSVNSLSGRRKMQYFDNDYVRKYFNDDCHFGTAKLVLRNHKVFLHVPVTFEVDGFDSSRVCNIVGVDLGVNFLATSYDSKGNTVFYDGRAIKHKRAHYKQLRAELQRRQTPSARRRLKTIGRRENRWMQDVNHCISKALVESNPKGTLFVLEDLSGVKNSTELVRKKDRYVMVSWAFYDLRQKIEYKAVIKGSGTIAVNPAYTSQTCPKCGHTERSNRNKKMHVFQCRSCGYRSNDDRIGAMNLWIRGFDYIRDNQFAATAAASE